MVLVRAKKKNTKITLPRNQNIPGSHVNGATLIIGAQPPRNSVVIIAHMVVIATYSPSMNSRYGVEEYSTIKPATSSDSASTKSNGGRLVSAKAETKKIINIGNNGSQYQSKKDDGRPSLVPNP